MVKKGGARGGTYSAAGNFTLVNDLFGNLNTNIIEEANSLDQTSVEFIRNGDGAFLDFGQTNLAPPISWNDTLALTYAGQAAGARNALKGVDPRRGKYFSPVAGMPLECPGTVCNQSQDNKTISWNSIIVAKGYNPADFEIPNFPIGNSQIISDGMSEITEAVIFTDNGSNAASADFVVPGVGTS
jgi:hypothetical protein